MGESLPTSDLLFKTNNSLITQTYDPKLMSIIQNLAGFGAVMWNPMLKDQNKPLIYKSTELPFFDKNLASLSETIDVNCLMAHIRGVLYNNKQVVTVQNNHPFLYEGTNIAFCHNGSIYGIDSIKQCVYSEIPNEISKQIQGTTDSELMYALFLSKLKDKYTNKVEDIENAVLEMLEHISHLRKKLALNILSPVNLFISNGNCLVATRYSFDFGHFPAQINDLSHFKYHSLWYTTGKSYKEFDDGYNMSGQEQSSIIIASEPLTKDMTSWMELPEYTMISVKKNAKSILDINITNIEI